MKKRICQMLWCLGFLWIFSTAVKAESLRFIDLYVDGCRVSSNIAPVIQNGRTLVPVRMISESLGIPVQWDAANKTVRVGEDTNFVLLKLNDRIAMINGTEPMVMDVPATIHQSRTMVPIRFVAEFFKKTVEWKDETYTVVIGPNYRDEREEWDKNGRRYSVLSHPIDGMGDFRSIVWDNLRSSDIPTIVVNWDFNGDGVGEKLVLGRDNPNGTKISILGEQQGENLAMKSEVFKALSDEFGELPENYYMEAVIYDLDGDGKHELLVIFSDGQMVKTDIAVFKIEVSGKGASGKEIASLKAENAVSLMKGGVLRLYFGNGGMYREAIWNGKAFEVSKDEKYD